MATIYDLKPRFQALLRPLCRALAGVGVTANQVTLFAIVLSVALGACIAAWPAARWPLFLVPAGLFARMALNAIDGMLAREHDMRTPLGAALNELGDVVSDAALYLPFAFLPGVPAAWVTIVVVLGILTELAGVVAVQIGASRRYDGPLGKSDRAFAFGLLALLLALGFEPGVWVELGLVAAAILGAFTVVNRVRRALSEIG